MPSTLRTSLNWLNIYAELLGVQSYALWRIRAMMSAGVYWPSEFEADVHLVVSETERVRDRFMHWEEIVDRCTAQLSPIGYRE